MLILFRFSKIQCPSAEVNDKNEKEKLMFDSPNITTPRNRKMEIPLVMSHDGSALMFVPPLEVVAASNSLTIIWLSFVSDEKSMEHRRV